jgi:riboflavin kinase/FMN adenylyltransferase
VRSGELETAAAFLGRAYSLCGTVVRGMRIGRKLGFPTANIDPQNEVYPPSGVYAVKVKVGETSYPGVLNIGYRPTMRKRDDLQVAIEAHIMGFSERIYGSTVEVVFYRKLRQEKLFEDNEDLISQIRRDIAAAERILSEK